MGIDELEYSYLAGQNGIYTGSLNEQRVRYYNSQAGTNYGNVNEAEMAFLRSKTSATTKSINDLWRAYLVSIGISETFSIDEMKVALWSGGGVSSFSPSDISGLLLWLKSESLDVLSDTDPISTWVDSSGGGFDATQSLTKRPTKQTVGGVSIARFDGVNDSLINATMTAIGTGDFHLFVVAYALTGSVTVFTVGNGAGSNPLVSRVANNLYVNPLGSGTNVTDGAWALDTWKLIEVKEASGTVGAKFYGGSETTGALTTSTNAGYVIGDYSNTESQMFKGDIAEVILYNSIISGDNLTNIESYLATKYGL